MTDLQTVSWGQSVSLGVRLPLLSLLFLARITRITRIFLPSPLDLDDARELFGIVTFLDIYGKVLIVIFSSICSRTSAIVTLCEETLCEETLCEETLCEETLCEETLCEETLCEETLCEETLCEETLCEGKA